MLGILRVMSDWLHCRLLKWMADETRSFGVRDLLVPAPVVAAPARRAVR
jgi:hypothetical protein